jgi:hypothetical protein
LRDALENVLALPGQTQFDLTICFFVNHRSAIESAGETHQFVPRQEQ